MRRQVNLTHDYPDVSAERLWRLVTDYAALHEISAPFITFTGVPLDGHVSVGDDWKARVQLFGRLPAQDYRMRVVACDQTDMTFRSEECGAGVDAWIHELNVKETDGGSSLRERITIDAGVLTPLFAAWARFLYGRRHGKRLAILARDKAHE